MTKASDDEQAAYKARRERAPESKAAATLHATAEETTRFGRQGRIDVAFENVQLKEKGLVKETGM